MNLSMFMSSYIDGPQPVLVLSPDGEMYDFFLKNETHTNAYKTIPRICLVRFAN
jgi:hypothetical protein